MEAVVKRKVPDSRTASPTRFGNSTLGIESPFTVKAKLSPSSAVRSSTPRPRSPSLLHQASRPRSPLRPNYAPNAPPPLSKSASQAVFPIDSNDSALGFVPKAKRSALGLNRNSPTPRSSPTPPSVSVTRPMSKMLSLKSTNPSSNSSTATTKPAPLRNRSPTRSRTPTARPDTNRRLIGSDDGRSSNFSSHPSSSASVVSSSNVPSSLIPVHCADKEPMNTHGTSIILGVASGHQPSAPSSLSPNNRTPIRVRAKLSDFSSPSSLTRLPQNAFSSDVSTPTLGGHSRANSVSSNSSRRPVLTSSPLHRRTPSATFQSDKQRSKASSISIPRSPQGPSCPTSPSRLFAHTPSSSASLKGPPNAMPLPLLSRHLATPESPVTSILSSLSSSSDVCVPIAAAAAHPPVPPSGASDVSSLSANASIEQASSEGLGLEYLSSAIPSDHKKAGRLRVVSTSSPESESEGVDARIPNEGEAGPALFSPFNVDGEKDARMQAKSDRKIADLEITNRSLMTINTQLEAEKIRQSREIRELKRRLRESRLILPPGAYKALQAQRKRTAATAVPTNGSRENLNASPTYDIEDDDEDSDDNVEQPPDPVYGRVTALIDQLITRAQEAVQSTTEGVSDGAGAGLLGTKVLSPDEVQMHYAQQEAGDAIMFSDVIREEGSDHLGDVAPDLDALESELDDSVSGFGDQ